MPLRKDEQAIYAVRALCHEDCTAGGKRFTIHDCTVMKGDSVDIPASFQAAAKRLTGRNAPTSMRKVMGEVAAQATDPVVEVLDHDGSHVELHPPLAAVEYIIAVFAQQGMELSQLEVRSKASGQQLHESELDMARKSLHGAVTPVLWVSSVITGQPCLVEVFAAVSLSLGAVASEFPGLNTPISSVQALSFLVDEVAMPQHLAAEKQHSAASAAAGTAGVVSRTACVGESSGGGSTAPTAGGIKTGRIRAGGDRAGIDARPSSNPVRVPGAAAPGQGRRGGGAAPAPRVGVSTRASLRGASIGGPFTSSDAASASSLSAVAPGPASSGGVRPPDAVAEAGDGDHLLGVLVLASLVGKHVLPVFTKAFAALSAAADPRAASAPRAKWLLQRLKPLYFELKKGSAVLFSIRRLQLTSALRQLQAKAADRPVLQQLVGAVAEALETVACKDAELMQQLRRDWRECLSGASRDSASVCRELMSLLKQYGVARWAPGVLADWLTESGGLQCVAASAKHARGFWPPPAGTILRASLEAAIEMGALAAARGTLALKNVPNIVCLPVASVHALATLAGCCKLFDLLQFLLPDALHTESLQQHLPVALCAVRRGMQQAPGLSRILQERTTAELEESDLVGVMQNNELLAERARGAEAAKPDVSALLRQAQQEGLRPCFRAAWARMHAVIGIMVKAVLQAEAVMLPGAVGGAGSADGASSSVIPAPCADSSLPDKLRLPSVPADSSAGDGVSEDLEELEALFSSITIDDRLLEAEREPRRAEAMQTLSSVLGPVLLNAARAGLLKPSASSASPSASEGASPGQDQAQAQEPYGQVLFQEGADAAAASFSRLSMLASVQGNDEDDESDTRNQSSSVPDMHSYQNPLFEVTLPTGQQWERRQSGG